MRVLMKIKSLLTKHWFIIIVGISFLFLLLSVVFHPGVFATRYAFLQFFHTASLNLFAGFAASAILVRLQDHAKSRRSEEVAKLKYRDLGNACDSFYGYFLEAIQELANEVEKNKLDETHNYKEWICFLYDDSIRVDPYMKIRRILNQHIFILQADAESLLEYYNYLYSDGLTSREEREKVQKIRDACRKIKTNSIWGGFYMNAVVELFDGIIAMDFPELSEEPCFCGQPFGACDHMD